MADGIVIDVQAVLPAETAVSVTPPVQIATEVLIPQPLAIEVATGGSGGGGGTPGPPGQDGQDGTDGVDGQDGASAYEIAVANGFVGTEAAWLLSLKGAKGDPGQDGAPGAPGADGQDGLDGAQGPAGPQNLFVQQTQPVMTTPGLWVQTNPDGSIKTMWIGTT